MALNGFQYRSGPWDCDEKLSTASTAIAVLDALKATSGKLLPLTTGVKNVGVALEAKAVGDAATTAIQYIKTSSGRTVFLAGEKRASSALAATDAMGHHDIKGATAVQGFDSSATTNLDIYVESVIIIGAVDVGQALIKFADPAYQNATN
jgi:hypothetical protein